MSENKETENHQKDVLDEFNEQFGQQEKKEATGTPVAGAPTIVNGRTTSLGQVTYHDTVNTKSADQLLGYIDLPVVNLPSAGRFYPDDLTISIRAAKVAEIRDFSIIDEQNPKDVADRIGALLSNTVKVMRGNAPVSYKELLEADKLMLVFHVRALTFDSGLSSIKVPVPASACQNCHYEGDVPLDWGMVQIKHPAADSILERYYDEENKCYTVKTKTLGTFQLKPPTIGTAEYLLNWIVTNQNKKWDKALVPLLAYFINYKERPDLFKKAVEAQSWPTKKFSLVNRLVEELEDGLGIETEFKTVCPDCGSEITIPFQIGGGLKSIFVEDLSDLTEELI